MVGLVLAGLVVVVVAVAWVRPAAMARYRQVSAPPSCGSAGARGPGLDARGGTAELCFVRAFRTCTPRSLLYVSAGVDTSETNDLRVVRSSGSCHIVDIADYRGVWGSRTVELDCSGAAWDGSGWVLACGPSTTVKLWWPRANASFSPIQPIPEPSA